MRVVIWFSVAFVTLFLFLWNCFCRPAGCHRNMTWAKCVSLLYLKSVHDSEPREDVINTPWCLASIFQQLEKQAGGTGFNTPDGNGCTWGKPFDSSQVRPRGLQLRKNKQPSRCYEIMVNAF
jgi:hypothetical protein